jgi:Glutamine amidotransferase domain
MRLIQALPGPPLGAETGRRRRPAGRIGGLAGLADPSAVSALTQALGAGARVLGTEPEADVVADWDACWLDAAPVADLERWRALLAAGRLAEVDGAFAVAWRTADGAWHFARDAVGERTLYYAPLAGGVAFASTVPALLATGLVPRTPDLAAVASYLTYAYVHPGTAARRAHPFPWRPARPRALLDASSRAGLGTAARGGRAAPVAPGATGGGGAAAAAAR